MVNTRGTHKRRRLPAAVYLCYLLVAVLAFTGASVAGYKTENSGDDSARVARFEVVMAINAGQANDYTLDTSSSAKSMTYGFSVQNNSEVAARYNLTVKFGSALPSRLSLKIDGVAGTTTDNQTFTFSSDGWMLAPEASANHTITIYAPAKSVSSTKTITGIEITANVEQID